MTKFTIGERAVSIIDLWSIFTTLSAVTGISFLFGCFDPFGANFLFLFGFEDILVATVYAMGAVSIFCLILWFSILSFQELATILYRRARNLSEYSWPVAAPALVLMTSLAFGLAAYLTSYSSGEVNFATTSAVALPLALGLIAGFCALRGYEGFGFARRSGALRLGLSLASACLVLVLTPNAIGFAFMIYLWGGPDEVLTGDNLTAENPEYFGWLACKENQQVLWIGSKVTIMRCNNDIVGRLNSSGNKFHLTRVTNTTYN